VATAAGYCYGALGTDTGGSIRMPSAAQGLTGLKPTWGRVSRQGVFPLAESFDHVGPMARSAADAAAMLQAIAGPDPADPTTLTSPPPDYLAELRGDISGLRLGLDPALLETVEAEPAAGVEQTIRTLEALGARVVAVRLPEIRNVVGAIMALLTAEMSAAHAETFPNRAEGYGPDLRRRLEAGAAISGVDVARAVHARAAYSGEMRRLFEDVDLMITAAAPAPTPTWDEVEAFGDDMPGLLDRVGRYTLPFNVTGNPTLSLPCGLAASGLPLGVQLIGPHLGEALLLRAGHRLQQVTDHHLRHPRLD
jgi:amidase